MQVIENHLHRTFALLDGVTLRHGFILHKERSGIKAETVQSLHQDQCDSN